MKPELKQKLEKLEDDGLRSFSLEMKRSYALANKEPQWAEMAKSGMLKDKMQAMYNEVSYVPIRAHIALFKKARDIMAEMQIPMTIPNVVILKKAWSIIKDYWDKHEREALIDYHAPRIPQKTFDREVIDEMFEEMKKLGVINDDLLNN